MVEAEEEEKKLWGEFNKVMQRSSEERGREREGG